MANVSNSCSICLVNFPENTKFVNKAEISFSGDKALDVQQMKAIATKCDHVFHEGCLAKWIEEYHSKTTPPPCPNCRKSLIEQSAIISPSSNVSLEGIPGGILGLQGEQNLLELSLDELLSQITLAEPSLHSYQEPSSYESPFGASMPMGEFSQGLQLDQFPLEPAFPSTPFGQNPLMFQTSSNTSSSWTMGGSSNYGLPTGMPSLHIDEPHPLTSLLQNLLGGSGSSSCGSIPF